MGSDKGLLKEGPQPWAGIAAEKLKTLPLPVVVSVNKNQLPPYANIFPSEQLVVDNEALLLKGPLLGLLSVYQKFPQQNLFVLACDMKDVTPTLLQNLYIQSTQSHHDAFVFTTDNQPQPLCGVYKCEGLKTIYEKLEAGELKRYSMMHVLETLTTQYLPVKKEDLPQFNNYNDPTEL